MTYTSRNYYMGTEATFEPCERPSREADYVSDSGSAYWYSEDGVVRESDHWGREVASCNWYLGEADGAAACWDSEGVRCGFCAWGGFERNAERNLEVTVYGVDEADADGRDWAGVPYAVFAVTADNSADGYVSVYGLRVRFRNGWMEAQAA